MRQLPCPLSACDAAQLQANRARPHSPQDKKGRLYIVTALADTKVNLQGAHPRLPAPGAARGTPGAHG
jgi:hypothetical protein